MNAPDTKFVKATYLLKLSVECEAPETTSCNEGLPWQNFIEFLHLGSTSCFTLWNLWTQLPWSTVGCGRCGRCGHDKCCQVSWQAAPRRKRSRAGRKGARAPSALWFGYVLPCLTVSYRVLPCLTVSYHVLPPTQERDLEYHHSSLTNRKNADGQLAAATAPTASSKDKPATATGETPTAGPGLEMSVPLKLPPLAPAQAEKGLTPNWRWKRSPSHPA